MKTHAVMIDIETLGTLPDSAIIQVGISIWKYGTSPIHRVWWNVEPDLDKCSVDLDTVLWWVKQRTEVTDTLGTSPFSYKETADSLVHYLEGLDVDVWAYGVAFDIVMMEHLFRIAGVKCPWSYRDVMDSRTLHKLYPDITKVEPEIAHNAGADALAQAQWVARALEAGGHL